MKKGNRIECLTQPLVGWTGTIVRPRISDNGAWVRFDKDIPEAIQTFNDDRRNDVLLYPENYKIIGA